MTFLPVFLNTLAEQQHALELPVPVESKPALLPIPNPTKSFWIDSLNANPLAKEGSEGPLTHDADICIIGAGITGISAAYHITQLLAERRHSTDTPLKIAVLDARDFCSGATGRNGGHLTPAAFRAFSGYAALYGTDEALRAIALEDHTASDIVRLLKETGRESVVDLVEGGHVMLLLTEAEVALAREDYKAAKSAGVNVRKVQFLSKDEMNKAYGIAYAGVRIPGHNFWPLKFVTHLYTLAKDIDLNSTISSLNLHTNTPVTAIGPISPSSSSRRWNLTTPRGAVTCSYVIHATNAYASHLLPHMHGPSGIIPTRGQILALRAASSLEQLTRSSWDGNQGFEYWFPRPLEANETHPLVIIGGGREATKPRFELYTVDDSIVNPIVGETLRKFLPAVFPGKYEEDREPEMEWSGIMGYTRTFDPFVGTVLDKANPDAYAGQYISAGYSGHGMPRAYGCGEAVAQMIVANITGTECKVPEWLPTHYLTENRVDV